jgi:hypothetical protein
MEEVRDTVFERGEDIVLLESAQAFPARHSDESSVKVCMLECNVTASYCQLLLRAAN